MCTVEVWNHLYHLSMYVHNLHWLFTYMNQWYKGSDKRSARNAVNIYNFLCVWIMSFYGWSVCLKDIHCTYRQHMNTRVRSGGASQGLRARWWLLPKGTDVIYDGSLCLTMCNRDYERMCAQWRSVARTTSAQMTTTRGHWHSSPETRT